MGEIEVLHSCATEIEEDEMVKLVAAKTFLKIGTVLEMHPSVGKPSVDDLLPNIHSTLYWLFPLENLAHSSHETMSISHTIGSVVSIVDFRAFFENFLPPFVSLSCPLSAPKFIKCLQCPVPQVGIF